MAARKSTKRARKRSARKQAPGKGAPGARKKAARKAARKPARPRKAAPRTPTAEAVARRIVRATQNPARMSIPELYTEDCISVEPGDADPAVGHAGIEGKYAFWEQLQDGSKTRWTARNVFVKRNTVCIEWDAEVALRGDGRVVRLQEIAVHELKGGKIARERYYYDPSVLGTGAAAPEPEPPRPAVEPGRPPVDPLDL